MGESNKITVKPTYAEKPWLKIYDALGLQSSFEYPEIPLFELIDRAASNYPDASAAVYLGREYKYRELKSYVDRLASALAELGVNKGDVIGVQCWNSPQFIISVYGALKAGATVGLFNPLLPLSDLTYMLKVSGAKAIITLDEKLKGIVSIKSETKLEQVIITSVKDFSAEEPEIKEKGDALQLRNLISSAEPNPPKVEINPKEDVALLFFTGGTTGVPKGVMLTHYNLVTNVLQTFGPTAGIILDVYRGDFAVLGAIPFSHIYGFTCAMNLALNWAGNLLLVPDPRDNEMIYQLIKKYHPLFAPAVPTQFMRLAESKGIDLNELKGSIPFSGSAALPPEVSKTYEKKADILVSEGYGLSETSPVTHSNFVTILKGVGISIDMPLKIGSIGVPVPETDVRIVDLEEGTQDIPVGEPGEMIIRGPQVMKGYWPTPGNGLRDGWVYTGDICKMDEDGYFYVVDRIKDMINVSGYKVYGRVVDDVLYEHPAVSRAAAIGIPDPKRPGSERIKVFVRVREEYKPSKQLEEDIVRHCKEHLPPYAVPKFVEFKDDLPLTSTEKIFKRKLREEEIEKQKAKGKGGFEMSKQKVAKAKPKAAAKEKKTKAAVEAKPEAASEGNGLKRMIEEMLDMPDKELMGLMPSLAPGIKGNAPDLLNVMPDLPQKLAQRLSKSNVKEWATEAPEATDAFTDMLWEMIGAMVEKNPELKKAVTGVGDIKVNYEATDSPMKGHYNVSGGKIIGGPGEQKAVDLTITSNTDNLIKLVIGGLDPIKGLMTRKFKLDGPLATGMKLAIVTKAMAQAFKGE